MFVAVAAEVVEAVAFVVVGMFEPTSKRESLELDVLLLPVAVAFRELFEVEVVRDRVIWLL